MIDRFRDNVEELFRNLNSNFLCYDFNFRAKGIPKLANFSNVSNSYKFFVWVLIRIWR